MREREIDREKDGDRVDKIGLQQPRRSSTAATRSVLGGSGIVEGGFERSVSLATWERQIGDVGGEMGFIGVRESFALVDRVHAELEVGEVRLSERREENGENPLVQRGKRRRYSSESGWTSDRRRGVGWSSVSLSLVRGVKLKSLASRIVWSEEFWKCFEGKITSAIVFRV